MTAAAPGASGTLVILSSSGVTGCHSSAFVGRLSSSTVPSSVNASNDTTRSPCFNIGLLLKNSHFSATRSYLVWARSLVQFCGTSLDLWHGCRFFFPGWEKNYREV